MTNVEIFEMFFFKYAIIKVENEMHTMFVLNGLHLLGCFHEATEQDDASCT